MRSGGSPSPQGPRREAFGPPVAFLWLTREGGVLVPTTSPVSHLLKQPHAGRAPDSGFTHARSLRADTLQVSAEDRGAAHHMKAEAQLTARALPAQQRGTSHLGF
ncbi:unnamed protein product [Rangifer tarandus platyrhynchus]|uniref:Uncharacterized protein n=1 Tax=Rangifer tarandus platyrhynchus TaxID=3082113 RepID=A0AC59YK17_RANTA